MVDFQKWLHKAKDDLLWTKSNIENSIYYGACFTAQQAAEKALKSYLLFHNRKLRKIHDLIALTEDCKNIDDSFSELQPAAKVLYPYYIETRYPGFDDFVSFTEEQAQEALQSAEQIVDFVERKLLK
ncbi:TPA: DNA-binding protein [Patescibacteria group bacterium]|uniref:HEPN domain protein n=1 Tax=Candidatus Gottesmanbacteria bacterium GW2011_GWA1_43_11 TaxID=1618436 RepID=A0A0G1CKN5_9BACT|nr:MAG: HEPN domain protein [Candidatus Gottesmanbacteria bacterium GW2011_GWA1_43_11]HCS78128.1 DNA-binding protein [Patescibacteria group bacterium]